MIGLVIVICFIDIGKTQGPISTQTGAINVRILPSIPLDSRTFTVPVQGRFVSLAPQVLPRSNSVQRLASTDRLRPGDINDSDLYLRPPTLRENQPNRMFFIPQIAPDIPSQPEAETNKSTVNENYRVDKQNIMNSQQFQTPGQHEMSKSNVTTHKPYTPAAELQNSLKENETMTQMKNTTEKITPKPSIVDKATGVEVTLDERASFDGDKCPTGYVRINGMCVEKD